MPKHKNEKNYYKNDLLIKGLILNVLVSSPALLGFGIILASKGPLNSVVLSTGCFLAGITGIIIMVRKESPMSIGSVHGKWAVFEGLIFTILCWVAAFYFALFGLS
jgi:hypothetical protein